MEKSSQNSEIAPFYARHLFGAMVIGSIIVAIILVFVSMSLYYSSGASQLDLSSPSYVDVRDQIDNSDSSVDYPSTGKMNSGAIADFKTLFTQKVQKVKSFDIFGGDPLNPESLGMTVATDVTTTAE